MDCSFSSTIAARFALFFQAVCFSLQVLASVAHFVSIQSFNIFPYEILTPCTTCECPELERKGKRTQMEKWWSRACFRYLRPTDIRWIAPQWGGDQYPHWGYWEGFNLAWHFKGNSMERNKPLNES